MYGVIVCQMEERLKPEHFMRRTREESLPNRMGRGKMSLVLLVPPAVYAYVQLNKRKDSHPLWQVMGMTMKQLWGTGGLATIEPTMGQQHPGSVLYNLGQVAWVAVGSSAKLPPRFTPASCACYFFNSIFVAYAIFRIVSRFFPSIVSPEMVFQQISSPQAACYSPSPTQQHTFEEEGKEGNGTGADELICSLDRRLRPFPAQRRTAPLNTIKYWQLHSKLHLWFVYCVSRKGNSKSASGMALLCRVGNISDSHQSLFISDYNGDKTWKWKCSCRRAGVGINHFSTDATGKIDYNHSPVSCAGWSWLTFNLYSSDGVLHGISRFSNDFYPLFLQINYF